MIDIEGISINVYDSDKYVKMVSTNIMNLNFQSAERAGDASSNYLPRSLTLINATDIDIFDK